MKGKQSITIFQPAVVALIFSTSLFFLGTHDMEDHKERSLKSRL